MGVELLQAVVPTSRLLQAASGIFYGRTELELIWRAPNTPAKIVFLTNRYLTLLVGVIGLAYWSAVREVGESTFCQVILWIPLIFTIVILFTHFVLVVQVSTLYHDVPVTHHVLLVLVALNFANGVYCFLRAWVTSTIPNQAQGYNACSRRPDFFTIIQTFICPTILHTILFAMTAYKAWSYRRATRGIISSSINEPLFYYQLIFTVVIAMVYVGSMIMALQPLPLAYRLSSFFPAVMLTQVCLGKMYLGLKKENQSARLYAALGEGLDQLEILRMNTWVLVDESQANGNGLPNSADKDIIDFPCTVDGQRYVPAYMADIRPPPSSDIGRIRASDLDTLSPSNHFSRIIKPEDVSDFQRRPDGIGSRNRASAQSFLDWATLADHYVKEYESREAKLFPSSLRPAKRVPLWRRDEGAAPDRPRTGKSVRRTYHSKSFGAGGTIRAVPSKYLQFPPLPE